MNPSFPVRDGYALTYLAFGAGDDSTFLLRAAEEGLYGIVRPDIALFADTGDEPGYTYEHVYRLAERAEVTPGAIPIHVCRANGPGLFASLRRSLLRGRTPSSQPPFWTREVTPDGWDLWGNRRSTTKDGQLPRACTRDFKIRVAHRYIRHLLGVRAFTPRLGIRVRCLIGIAADEIERVAPSREPWCDVVHPLVDAGITKKDEHRIAAERGWTLPGKSSCVACPYHGDDFYRKLKAEAPADWERACLDDESLRRLPNMRAETFVHRSRKPLRMAVLGNEPDAFGNDCSGTCG